MWDLKCDLAQTHAVPSAPGAAGHRPAGPGQQHEGSWPGPTDRQANRELHLWMSRSPTVRTRHRHMQKESTHRGHAWGAVSTRGRGGLSPPAVGYVQEMSRLARRSNTNTHYVSFPSTYSSLKLIRRLSSSADTGDQKHHNNNHEYSY